MKTSYIKHFSILMFLLTSMIINSCGQDKTQDSKKETISTQKQVPTYKVTFIELGSVRCIPCQKMQPIMKSIEEKYGTQVKVEFYDVWTPLGKPMATQYNINLIPTQVFLDENGKEFYRHEGYFPEEELVKVLKTKGVK